MADESVQGATPEQVEDQVEATATDETATEETQAEESSEETEEQPSEEPTEDPPKKKSGIEKRFSDLTARAKAAEQYAQRLEQLYHQQMEMMQRPPQQPQVQAPQPPATLPDRYDFDSDEHYQKAVDSYMDAQFQRRIQGLQQQALERRQQESVQQKQVEMQKKISAIRDKGAQTYEDFSEVAYVPQALVDIVAVTDNPHEIAYRWGKNPDEWQQLMTQLQANPYEVAARIGKIDAEISGRVKKQTAAPPPVKPVGGRGEAVVDPDKMPIEQWIKWREAQLKKKA